MELQGFLKALVSKKPVTINLFNEKGLLLISFNQEGWKSLDDFLCDDEVIKIEIINLFNINVTIDTEPDGNTSEDSSEDSSDPSNP